jgi:hypothetical protein
MKHNKILTIFILCLIIISIIIEVFNSLRPSKVKTRFIPKGPQIMFLAIILIPISRIFLND